MRKILFLILVLQLQVIKAQNQEIKTNLPIIIPPSPTVAALMKFEEIPVSNYTGIPDITIPLFSSATHSKDINLDIALKYHPASVGVDEKSSDVGLGWSLFAGGTISRTVRGLPDEELTLGSSGNTGKVGIYQTTVSNHINNYYFFTQNLGNINPDQVEIVNEFLWESAEKGRYDYEHDLWQFNFMGFTGRFYIKKNMTTGILEVKPLDDYRVKIINNYYTIGNLYILNGFTIYDEKGIKYVFDVKETTNTSTATQVSWSNLVPNDESITASKAYNSAFHLSKVYDANNNLAIEFVFNQSSVNKECVNNQTRILNENYGSICKMYKP